MFLTGVLKGILKRVWYAEGAGIWAGIRCFSGKELEVPFPFIELVDPELNSESDMATARVRTTVYNDRLNRSQRNSNNLLPSASPLPAAPFMPRREKS